MTEASPGVVGIIAQDLARYTVFSSSVTGLETPPGSQVIWQYGHSIPANMNLLVERFLAVPEADWLWILGDDHAFSPGLLTKLLEAETHAAVAPDIVVPVCLSRQPPHQPVIYSGLNPGGGRQVFDVDEVVGDGPVEIHSAGSAGMLVRRYVFETLPSPWFEAYQLDGQQLNEDFVFCDRARAAGFGLWCRLDANLGHCITGAIWPVREVDGLHVGLSLMTGAKIILPK